MSTLRKNSRTIRTRRGQTFEVEVDDSLELGLNLAPRLRRVFNVLYLMWEQTPSGWTTDAVIVRIGFGYDAAEVSDTIIRNYIQRLRCALRGTEWGIESVIGGSYRLVKIEPGREIPLRHHGAARPKNGSELSKDHPWRQERRAS